MSRRLVVDAHVDLLLELVARRDEPSPFRDSWLEPLRAGNVGVQVCPIYLFWDQTPERAMRATLEQVLAWRRAGAENPGAVRLIRSAADLDAALDGERVGLLLSMEGTDVLGPDPELMDLFHELGVRMVGLTHFQRNQFADGNAEPAAGGLSTVGRVLVQRLERLGIMIDLAHTSEATFSQVLEVAPAATVLVSHAACRALADSPRNHSDAQLKALAARGGVIGIFAVPMFLGGERGAIDPLVDHILHAMDVAGPEHVGLGGDFMARLAQIPGLVRLPPWLNMGIDDVNASVSDVPGPEGYPRLAEALQRRGVDGELLDGVLGGNFLRLLRQGLPQT